MTNKNNNNKKKKYRESFDSSSMPTTGKQKKKRCICAFISSLSAVTSAQGNNTGTGSAAFRRKEAVSISDALAAAESWVFQRRACSLEGSASRPTSHCPRRRRGPGRAGPRRRRRGCPSLSPHLPQRAGAARRRPGRRAEARHLGPP